MLLLDIPNSLSFLALVYHLPPSRALVQTEANL